jgi:hypothetical protein
VLKRRLSHAAIESDPNAVWNAYIESLASSAYDELNHVQRPPQLAFWYESEVQNGGHLQFFKNQREESIQPTVEALVVIGAVAFADILRNAMDRRRFAQASEAGDVKDFISLTEKGEFSDLDRAYYAQRPTMISFLESYLAANFSEFIVVEA